MTVKTITYHKVFSLGNYENEKIGVEIELQPGDDVQKALNDARAFVEYNHQLSGFQTDLEKCDYVINNPDEFTGNQVRQAKEKKERIRQQMGEGLKLLQ